MNPQQFNFLGNNTLQNFQNNTGGVINQTSNESEKFPGLTKQQETEIMNKANQANVTESQKNYILNDMYQQQLRRNQIDKFAEEREGMKRQLLRKAVESKDVKTSNNAKETEKKGDVADMIRKYVSATQEIDLNKLNKVPDDQIIADFTADNPDVAYAIDDFTKSQMSSQYFSEMMGFSQFEEQQDEGFFKNLLNSITYGVETGAKGLKGLIDKGLDTVEGNSNESSYSMENLTAFDNYIQHKYGVSGSQLRESDKEVWQQERNLVQDNPEVLKQYMTTASEDALNFAEGYTDALFTATNPYMALGMKTVGAGEQEMGGGVLTWLAEKMGGVGEIINSIPGLSNYRDTLSPEDQQRFDAFVGNVAVGLILGTKNKKNIIKDPKTFLMENLQPNQITKNFVQSVTGMPDKFLGGADSLAGGAKGLMSKATKGVDNAGNLLDRGAERGAKKITGTTSAQDKLYKAQEPRMNVLSEKKNLEKRRANSDRANELILENGYKPTNTSERLDAHQKTLNKLWGEVMDKVNKKEGVVVDQTPMIEALSNYIKEKKKLGVAGIESDIKALEAELKALKKMQAEGNTDVPILENKKQIYNDLIDRKGQEASEVYKGGIKLLTNEIGKIEDAIISEIPGEFSSLKRDVGALLDSYEDVFKSDMKNQRKKGLGLTETYSRLEGVGDTLGGIVKLFGGDASGVVKGLGKIALGKALAKATDVDFLIKQGFEDLYNEKLGGNKSQASSKTAKYQVADDMDKAYEEAVRAGDEAKAKEILRQYAESKGYKGTEDYKGRGAWAAPSSTVDKSDFRNLEKLGEALEDSGESSLYAVANGYSAMPEDMLERGNTWRYFRTNTEREAYYPIREAMDEIQRQMEEYGEVRDMPKVTVYRAVPDYSKSIKKLQSDIDKFIIGEDGKPHINGSLSQLSKDALESYDYYADMYKKYGGTTPEENLYERLTNDRDYKDSLSVKEGMLESGGEWVTPSKQYAKDHGNNRFDGEYKIIKDEIPADQLWWDGNAIEEWGFDDGNEYAVKKGTKNSRKNLEIEYDDKGNLIPLSKRFNEKKADPRYQKYGIAGEGEKGVSATEGLNIRNFKNGKTVQELADNYGIKTNIVDSISTPEGQKAYGMYGDRMITLAKDLKESTVPHELLHGVFDIVDNTRKTEILDGIKKRLKVDDVQAEEWLADNFSEYYRTGKFDVKGMPTTFVGKVKQFFQQIKEYIDGTYKNEKQIRQLFDDIIDGKIEGEYGVYSDPKFQSVWHGSPYEFEKFDSTHMGEGEGAQAHGWGHYVAVEEGTARHYAGMNESKTGGVDFMLDGKPYKEVYNTLSDFEKDAFDSFKAYRLNDYDFGEAWDRVIKNKTEEVNNGIKDMESSIKYGEEYLKKEQLTEDQTNRIKSLIENDKKRLEQYKSEKSELSKIDDLRKRSGVDNNLYEVEIPDPVKKDTPTGSNYWEEDAEIPKSQYMKIINEAKSRGLLDTKNGSHLDYYIEYATAGHGDKMTGYSLYRALEDMMESDEKASKFLESLGYDGIHYFGDTDGEAYVIFNDNALQITKHHKY